MLITVKLYAGLRQFGPQTQAGEGFQRAVPDGCSVDQLLELLGVPGNAPLVAMVNQTVVFLQHELAEGDVVCLFPPVAGG
jgi:molybdopterin converting factor small subunit